MTFKTILSLFNLLRQVLALFKKKEPEKPVEDERGANDGNVPTDPTEYLGKQRDG